jgi:heptosyltransferase-2
MDKKTILVRSPNWVGDAVVSTAILEPLRDYYCDHNIMVVTKDYVSTIFKNNPFIDDVIVFSGFKDGVKHINGDIGFILPNSFSSALLFALCGIKRRVGYTGELRTFLLTDAIPRPHLKEEHLVENYKRIVLKIVENNVNYKFLPAIYLSSEEKNQLTLSNFGIPEGVKPVIIDPGSAYGKSKIWQPEKYAAVVDYIVEKKKFPVILLGATHSLYITKEISQLSQYTPLILTGKLTLREAIIVISKCSLFISPDTGSMHIAAALGINQIAIFGSASPIWTKPLNKNSEVIYKNLPCSPCFKRKCPFGTTECLKKISFEDVRKKVDLLL